MQLLREVAAVEVLAHETVNMMRTQDSHEVAVAGVGVTRGRTEVETVAVALIDHVVRVTEADVAVGVSRLGDVADKVPRARVLVTLRRAEVELVLVALVGDEVGVTERRLALGDGSRVGSDESGEGEESEERRSELHGGCWLLD